MAGLHFDITGDNTNLLRKLKETENGVRTTSKSIEDSGLGIEDMFKRIQNAAAMSLAGFSAQQFVSQVAKVRGEFQQLEVAFNTMLGNKEQTDALMQQLVRTAAITPFDLEGVANGAKQLLAYGTASDKVNETLIRLGDIAAGLSMPLNDLVYLYGTTQTQGQLFTQDLRQFMGRGIPLADELAKQFGVTKDKVGELVTAGKVGFPEVEKAIVSMTSEGGKFGGLMEAQSKTISGQISNIEDAIDTMFNKIGKENESIINEALSGASYLVEHWEDVAIAIESAAVAYGTYKAAVMTTAALQESEQTLKVDTEIEGLKSLLIVKEESKNADLEAAVASGNLTEAKASELAMLREELAARLSSLKVKEAEAIAEHESALSEFNSAKEKLDASNEYLEKMQDLYEASLNQGDASYEQYAMEQMQTAMANQNTAATALNTAEKNLNAASSNRKAASEAVDTLATEANTVANHANTASMNIMKLAATQLTSIIKGLWASLMANPLFIVAGAVAGLGFAIYKVATAENEAEKATRLYNDAIDEQNSRHEEYKKNIEELNRKLSDNNLSEGERISAFQQLKAKYPTILENLNSEKEYLKEIAKYKKLIAEEDGRRSQADDLELLEEEERKLKHYQQVREKGTSTSLVDMNGNGWASDNVMDAIKAQTDIVNKQKAKVAEYSKNQFLGSIKDMTSDSIVSTIEDITLSLQTMSKAGDDAIGIVPTLGGEYSKQQLKTIKQSLEDEQKLRGTEKKNASEWIKNAKSNYDAALKNLKDFESSKKELTQIEYDREHERLKKEVEEAEKKYKELGGKSASKENEEDKKVAKEKEKQQKKLSEQLLSVRRKNQQDEINLMDEGTEKKLAQIDLDYQKELDAIEKQWEEWNKAQKGKLTDEQETQLSASEENAYKKYEKNVKDTNKEKLDEDRKAWQEYFIAFGDYQEKRKAIIQKYEDEIAKIKENGRSEVNIKTAEANKAKELSALDEQYGKSPKAMADLFEDASDKSVNAIQAIIDKYELLVSYLSGGNGVTVEDLKAVGFTDKDLKSIEDGTTNIKDVTDAIKTLKGTLGGKSPFKKFTEDIKSGIDEIKNAKGDTDKIGIGLSKIGKAASEFTGPLKEFSSNIGNIFGFDDSKVQGAIDAVGGLGQTAAGVGQIMSGDIVGGAMSAVQGISQVVSAFDGMFGADYSHYNAMKEQYDTLNSIWDELIDKKKEYINTSYGAEANKVGKEALELAEKSIESYRILGKERLNSGASAGSHSIGVRIRKGMSAEGWSQAREALGADFDKATRERMAGLFDLSVEQVEKLKEADIFWSKLDDDVREYLQGIIDGEERIKDIQNQIKEQLTQVSFDSVFDSFVDMLMNMDSSAEDFSKNFEQYMQRAIMTTMVGNKYKGKLQAWYDSFAKANDDKAGITKDEMERSQAEWDAIVAEALAERNALKDAIGWTGEGTTQQGGSRGAFETMSQDTASELNGRFTAFNESNEEIKNQMITAATGINSMVSIQTSGNEILSNILNLHVLEVSHLEDIVKYTKPLLEFGGKFDKMIDKLNTL